MAINTGISVTPEQMERWNQLSQQLRLSRNQVIGLLLDHAEVESRPVVRLNFGQNKSAVQSLAGHGAFASTNN